MGHGSRERKEEERNGREMEIIRALNVDALTTAVSRSEGSPEIKSGRTISEERGARKVRLCVTDGVTELFPQRVHTHTHSWR